MHAGEEFLALGSAHENPHDGFISDRARPVPGSVLPQVSDCSLTYARPGANHGRGRRHRRIRGCRDRRPCRLFYHGKLQGPWYANARDPPSGRPGGQPRWVVQVARTDVCHVAPIRMPRSRSLPCCPSTSSDEIADVACPYTYVLTCMSLRRRRSSAGSPPQAVAALMDADNQVCLSCITAGATASGFIEAARLAGRLAKRPG